MIILKFITLYLLSLPVSAQEVHFEHSIIQPEGSSWGTEGSLTSAISVEPKFIPPLYRGLNQRFRGRYYSVKDIPRAKGRFIKDKLALFKNVNVCYDRRLSPLNSQFYSALEGFTRHVVGSASGGGLPFFRFVTLDFNVQSPYLCDLIIVKGSWRWFPYQQLSSIKSGTSWKNNVFGLYYRFNDQTVPTITIHPAAILNFSVLSVSYVNVDQENRLIVDGITLLLHEMGHFLGFRHIDTKGGYFQNPELTAMGKKNDQRTALEIKLRFTEAKNLWSSWDPHQTSIYRQIHRIHGND